FIATQCRLHSLGPSPSPERDDLVQRERALLNDHGAEWLAALGLVPGEGTFVCGLVERLSLDGERFGELSSGVRQAPIRSLRVSPHGKAEPLLELMPRLPLLATLDLNEASFGSEIARLIDSPELGRLRALHLGENYLDAYIAGLLASAPHLARLA